MATDWLDLAERAFASSPNKPMHVDDIAAEVIRLRLNTTLAADELSTRFAGALNSNSKSKKNARFRRIKNKTGGFKRGIYALKAKRPITSFPEAPQEKVSTLYTGTAGEYAVLSELMFRGYNASVLPVDEGIDVIASKGNSYFHIQVKTANCLEARSGDYLFTIKRSAFESNRNSQTFYIFVIRTASQFGGHCEFLVFAAVMPPFLMARLGRMVRP